MTSFKQGRYLLVAPRIWQIFHCLKSFIENWLSCKNKQKGISHKQEGMGFMQKYRGLSQTIIRVPSGLKFMSNHVMRVLGTFLTSGVMGIFLQSFFRDQQVTFNSYENESGQHELREADEAYSNWSASTSLCTSFTHDKTTGQGVNFFMLFFQLLAF